MIPKKVREVVGPSIFSEASGIPRLEHNWMKFQSSAGRQMIVVGPEVGNHQGSEGCMKFPAELQSRRLNLPRC